MDYKDYYKILGVSKSATGKEIKSAYRKLAQQYHPDKNPGNPKAEDKFKEINEAYEALGDPQKRAKYDQLDSRYAQWERAGRPGGGFDFSQWTGGAGGAGGSRASYNDLNDLFSAGGFSDFFTSLFGGGGFPETSGRTSRRPLRGEDAEQPIEISLEEAYQGTERLLRKGQRRLEIKIPAGARTGTKVRVAGEGGLPLAGQVAGDLYLVVTVQPHARFRREGDDLHVDLPIELYTALLGGEARVPTLNGDMVLTIPPETQADKTFRLSGKGMPKLRQPDEYGDLYAHAVIRIPTNLTDEERKLITQLAALRRRK